MPAGSEDLLVRIDATTEQLRRELKRADRQVNQSSTRMQRSLRRVNGSFTRLNRTAAKATAALGAFGVALSVGAISKFVTKTVDATNTLAKAAKTADISVKALQELRFAFSQLTDVTDNQVDQSLQRFARRLGLARDEEGAARDTFGEIGVAMRDVGDNARDTERVLEDVMRALAEIENGAERAARASEMFGERMGPKLAAALREGMGPMRQMRADAHELGLVLSDDFIKNAERIADEFDRASRIIDVHFKRAVLELTPLLIDAARLMAKIGQSWSEMFTDRGRLQALKADRDRLEDTLLGRGDYPRELSDDLRRLIHERLLVIRRRIRELMKEENARGGGGSALQIDISGGRQAIAPMDVGARYGAIPEILAMEDIAAVEQLAKRFERKRQEDRAFLDDLFLEEAGRAGALRANQFATAGGLFGELPESDRRSISELNTELERLGNRTRETSNFADDLGFSFSSAFEDAALSARSLSDVLKGLGEDIARIVLRKTVTAPLGNAISGGIDYALGTRASGGPVLPGNAYQVGERGREIFMPRQPGTILPNGFGGSGEVTINIENHGEPVNARVTGERQASGGGRELDLALESKVKTMVRDGGLDREANFAWGVRRRGV